LNGLARIFVPTEEFLGINFAISSVDEGMAEQSPRSASPPRVPTMRDLHADWKKWTMFERVSALGGLCVMVVLVPVLTVAAVLTH
jgi:hypothetical protein